MLRHILKLLFISLMSFYSLADEPENSLLEDGKPKGLPINDQGKEKYDAGWTLHFDNDLLIPGSGRDQDYTGGLGVTFVGGYEVDTWCSI